MTGTKIKYNRAIENVPSKAYDELSAFIGRLEGEPRFGGESPYTYYILNGDETQIIRIRDETRAVEISDRVSPNIAEAINHIIRTEIRVSDLPGR